MNYRISRHAEESIREREIPMWVVRRVVEYPQQVVPGKVGRSVYQSLFTVNGKQFLIRVPVRDDVSPAEVLTAYRTSNIDKYWDYSGQHDRGAIDEGENR